MLQQEEVQLMEQVKEVKASLAEEDSRLRLLKERVDVRMFRLKVCRFLPQFGSRRRHLLVAGVGNGTRHGGLLCWPDTGLQGSVRI